MGSKFVQLMNLFKDSLKETFMRPIDEFTINDKPRLSYLDLSKGFCILLILMAHAATDYVPDWTLYLRVPLYFVVSGIFFRDYGGIFNFIYKKSNKILVPALFFYTLSFILISLSRAFMQKPPVEEGYLDFFFLNHTPFNSTIWFLFCLFNVNVIFSLFHYVSRGKPVYLLILCLLAGLIGCQLSIHETRLVFYLDSSLTAVPFFYAGWLLGKYNAFHRWNQWLTFGVGLAVLVAIIVYHQFDSGNRISFHENLIMGIPFLTFLMPCLFVTAFIFVAKIINWLPVISFFGRYSIIVLCTNSYAMIFADKIAVRGSIINFGIVILFCWCMIVMCRRYLPYFTAQKELKLGL